MTPIIQHVARQRGSTVKPGAPFALTRRQEIHRIVPYKTVSEETVMFRRAALNLLGWRNGLRRVGLNVLGRWLATVNACDKGHDFYAIKNHILDRYGDLLADKKVVQVIHAPCWSCDGHGDDHGSFVCCRCGGSGVFQTTRVLHNCYLVGNSEFLRPSGRLYDPDDHSLIGVTLKFFTGLVPTKPYTAWSTEAMFWLFFVFNQKAWVQRISDAQYADRLHINRDLSMAFLGRILRSDHGLLPMLLLNRFEVAFSQWSAKWFGEEVPF